jgi:hypothetical protein
MLFKLLCLHLIGQTEQAKSGNKEEPVSETSCFNNQKMMQIQYICQVNCHYLSSDSRNCQN